MFGAVCLLINTGVLQFREEIRDMLEERRMSIYFWQDMLIDMTFIILIMQICMLFINAE